MGKSVEIAAQRVFDGLDVYQQRIAKKLFTVLAQHQQRAAQPDARPETKQQLYVGVVACWLDLRWFELAQVVEIYAAPGVGFLKCDQDVTAQSDLALADQELITSWPTLQQWVAEAEAAEKAKKF